MRYFLPILILLAGIGVRAQVSMQTLLPAHAAALSEYLATRQNKKFLGETAIDKDYLASMRDFYGRGHRPFYAAGDFNGDRVGDFAVLVRRDGPTVEIDGLGEPHNIEYPLTITIFNGKKNGGYAIAFEEDIQAPMACSLIFDRPGAGTKPPYRLHWGVFETDNIVTFTPTRSGYKAEEPDMP